MKPLAGKTVVHADAVELARGAAEDLLSLAGEAIRARGRFSWALTGGSSPEALYRLLAEASFAEQMPWRDVHLFWGDDRVVPPAHPRSNFRLAERLFIDMVGIPSRNIHRVRGELGPRMAAERYGDEVREFFGPAPRFDLIHLGLGDDGHVASLFPWQRDTLLERRRHVMPALYRELGEWRVTLTYPVLNAARRVEILLPDGSKGRIARKAMMGPIDPVRIPAQAIRPTEGDLLWRLTRQVAAEIGPTAT